MTDAAIIARSFARNEVSRSSIRFGRWGSCQPGDPWPKGDLVVGDPIEGSETEFVLKFVPPGEIEELARGRVRVEVHEETAYVFAKLPWQHGWAVLPESFNCPLDRPEEDQ